LPVHKDTGGMNDTENLEASSDRNISVYVHSERDVGATAEQLENEDCSDNLLIEVTNNTANAPSAAQYTDEQITAEPQKVQTLMVTVSVLLASVSCPLMEITIKVVNSI